MKPITSDTGRITLTLTSPTIKALKLLAILKGQNQNSVAEDLLIQGGLHDAVDSEWGGGKPENSAVASTISTAPTSGLIPMSLMTDEEVKAHYRSLAMEAAPAMIEPARQPLPPKQDPDDDSAPWY